MLRRKIKSKLRDRVQGPNGAGVKGSAPARGGQEGLSEEAMYEQEPKEAEGGSHQESPNSHGYDGLGFEKLSVSFK